MCKKRWNFKKFKTQCIEFFVCQNLHFFSPPSCHYSLCLLFWNSVPSHFVEFHAPSILPYKFYFAYLLFLSVVSLLFFLWFFSRIICSDLPYYLSLRVCIYPFAFIIFCSSCWVCPMFHPYKPISPQICSVYSFCLAIFESISYSKNWPKKVIAIFIVSLLFVVRKKNTCLFVLTMFVCLFYLSSSVNTLVSLGFALQIGFVGWFRSE